MDIQSTNTRTAQIQSTLSLKGSPSPEPPLAQLETISKENSKIDIEALKRNLSHALGQINEQMRDGGRNLNFSMDDALGMPIIQVKKQDTGEIIRQIPSEEFVKFAHRLEELKGFLIDSGV